MIIVETPLQTITVELEKLVLFKEKDPMAKLYLNGAIDALSWLISGEHPASQGGASHFPMIPHIADHVH